MEEKIETVENEIVEGTGENKVATEKESVNNVELDAQKIADAMVAKKLKDMPSKEELKAYKEWKESQKTESEKQAEALKELETLRQEAVNAKRENALLKKGINNDDIDYVMFKVGKMEGEFDENLVEFLKENPKFTAKEETKATTTGVKINNVESQETGVSAILKAKHPELFN